MNSSPSQQRKRRPLVSATEPNGTIIELVLSRTTHRTGFALWRDGRQSVDDAYTPDAGKQFSPLPATNNLIRHGAVLLPEAPAAYGSTEELIAEIRQYIGRYVDLSEAFLGIACYYVLFTWVYDAFNELPYLRLRGDYGCGKTRALLVIGSICYKPFFASGASTVSPIFHTLDLFRGTLIFDEADFRFSDEKAELVKIFNNGNVRGFPVFRTSVTAKREFDPQAFVVFGPKIVAMRGAFEDAALESRFITEEMGQHPVRSNIPINLPDVQQDEALELRNRLLSYRFRYRGTARIDPALATPAASHRLNQILVPLLSVIPDEAARRAVTEAAARLESVIRSERAAGIEAKLLEVVEEALRSSEKPRVTIAEIATCFAERFGKDYERPITSRYIGSLIQKRLRLFAYKSHGNFVIPVTELPKVRVMCARYGIDVPAADTPRGDGDMGTIAEAA